MCYAHVIPCSAILMHRESNLDIVCVCVLCVLTKVGRGGGANGGRDEEERGRDSGGD